MTVTSVEGTPPTHDGKQERSEDGPQENAFPDEHEQLCRIETILSEAKEEAEKTLLEIDRDYLAHKRYLADNRGDADPREMFQGEQLLQQMDASGSFAADLLDRVQKLMDSPYFARIDFQRTTEPAPRPYYIGRFSFSHERQILIFDWRAPVSSMFYDCEVGEGGYDAPKGFISGTLTRKRQFKIKDARLEYALESSLNVQDDVLQKELAQTSDTKMKNIIATIQKEQNRIIREEQADTLMIQGVAGSGKTSIALHRVAYLLYAHKKKLTAQNVMILSPNRVFGSYIGNVLPELGEEPIYEFSFPDIAETQLEGVISFDKPRNPLEVCDEAWAQRVRFKSTGSFLAQLDRFIESLPDRIFQPTDYVFEPFIARADWIQTRFNAYPRYPIYKRLEMVAEDLRDRLETDNIRDHPLPRKQNILMQLKRMLLLKKTAQLYKQFYREIGAAKCYVPAGRNRLEWEDVFPFLRIHAALFGLETSRRIRHLVVDEMQDYTPTQYAVVNQLFPCGKTILGDFEQRVHPHLSHELSDIAALYPGVKLVHLTKSYRSTLEIIRFAKKIQPKGEMEPMERHGDPPRVISCADEPAQLRELCRLIRHFRRSDRVSLGILTKTDRESEILYKSLCELLSERPAFPGEFPIPAEPKDRDGSVRTEPSDCPDSEERKTPPSDLHHLSPGKGSYEAGISVASVRMSKGLEFDAVIVADADARHYAQETDRGILYVACTRAMHQLWLIHTGEKSPLLGEVAD